MDERLTFKDKCDLSLYLIDKLEEYWKRLFYSTMTIIGALLGGAYTKLLHLPIVAVIGFMFIAFTISNLIDHLRVYKFLQILIESVKKKYKLNIPELSKQLDKLPYHKEVYLCIGSYSFVTIGTIVITFALIHFK